MATDGAANTPEQQKKRQERFLAKYAATGNVSLACKAAKVGRTTHYNWLATDEDYRVAFNLAKEEANDSLFKEARRRAVEGVKEPVGWHQGQPGGYVRKYSDTLLIFLMKNLDERFREKHEVSGPDGGPIEMALTDQQRAERLLELVEKVKRRTEEGGGEEEGEGA